MAAGICARALQSTSCTAGSRRVAQLFATRYFGRRRRELRVAPGLSSGRLAVVSKFDEIHTLIASMMAKGPSAVAAAYLRWWRPCLLAPARPPPRLSITCVYADDETAKAKAARGAYDEKATTGSRRRPGIKEILDEEAAVDAQPETPVVSLPPPPRSRSIEDIDEVIAEADEEEPSLASPTSTPTTRRSPSTGTRLRTRSRGWPSPTCARRLPRPPSPSGRRSRRRRRRSRRRRTARRGHGHVGGEGARQRGVWRGWQGDWAHARRRRPVGGEMLSARQRRRRAASRRRRRRRRSGQAEGD